MNALPWIIPGLLGGTLHFMLLRWNTRLYLRGGDWTHALSLQLLRLATIALLLGFAARHGALPLLFTALGIMLARLAVIHLTPVAP